VTPENKQHLEVESWLDILGIDLFCQWDVLVFLHRHPTSLISAEHIARLLGHPTGEVVTALDSLESLGFVERSRVDQGVRLYQHVTPRRPGHGDILDRLLALGATRAGRLILSRTLRRDKPPNQGNGQARLQGKGRATCLKAV
jgi:hypothetical protein